MLVLRDLDFCFAISNFKAVFNKRKCAHMNVQCQKVFQQIECNLLFDISRRTSRYFGYKLSSIMQFSRSALTISLDTTLLCILFVDDKK